MQAFEATSDLFIDWLPNSESWKISGEDPVKVGKTKAIIVDPQTLLTGWGIWPEGGMPDYRWSETPGSLSDKPGDDWKKAFSLTVHLRKEDGWPVEGEALWRTPKVGSFQSIAGVWADVDKAAKKQTGALAKLKIKGTQDKSFKGGRSTTLVALEMDELIDAGDATEF